jgi:hypothetical protein
MSSGFRGMEKIPAKLIVKRLLGHGYIHRGRTNGSVVTFPRAIRKS